MAENKGPSGLITNGQVKAQSRPTPVRPSKPGGSAPTASGGGKSK